MGKKGRESVKPKVGSSKRSIQFINFGYTEQPRKRRHTWPGSVQGGDLALDAMDSKRVREYYE